MFHIPAFNITSGHKISKNINGIQKEVVGLHRFSRWSVIQDANKGFGVWVSPNSRNSNTDKRQSIHNSRNLKNLTCNIAFWGKRTTISTTSSSSGIYWTPHFLQKPVHWKQELLVMPEIECCDEPHIMTLPVVPWFRTGDWASYNGDCRWRCCWGWGHFYYLWNMRKSSEKYWIDEMKL